MNRMSGKMCLAMAVVVAGIALGGFLLLSRNVTRAEYSTVQTMTPMVPEVITTVPLGFGTERPLAIAVNPSNGYAYVAGKESNTVTVFSGTELVGTVAVGSGPLLASGMAVNPVTGYAYVTNYYSSTVTVLSGTQEIGTIPCSWPLAVAANPLTGYVYVSSDMGTGNTATVISGTEVVTTLPIGSFPEEIGVNPATGYVYVLNTSSDTVSVLMDDQAVATLPISRPRSISVNPVSGYVYIVNYYPDDNLTVISGTQVVAQLSAGGYPLDVAANPTTGYVYVANGASNDVSIISGTQVLTTLYVGVAPASVTVNPTTGYVYVANMGSDSISVLVGTELVDTLTVGAKPRTAVTNPANGLTYVANYDDQSVSIIRESLAASSVTAPTVPSPAGDLVIDFADPVITSTIQFSISPALPLTVTWVKPPSVGLVTSQSVYADRAIISHAPFTPGVSYTLSILPGGQTLSGYAVKEQSYSFTFLHRVFLPLTTRQ